MTVAEARQGVAALVSGDEHGALKRTLDNLVQAVRSEGAGLVKSLMPRRPDNEADEATGWALDMAAKAVERGRR
jgi:hypothetical protein